MSRPGRARAPATCARSRRSGGEEPLRDDRTRQQRTDREHDRRLRAPEVAPALRPPHDAADDPERRSTPASPRTPAASTPGTAAVAAATPTSIGKYAGNVARHCPTLVATPLPPRNAVHHRIAMAGDRRGSGEVGPGRPCECAANGTRRHSLGDVTGHDGEPGLGAEHLHRVRRARISRALGAQIGTRHLRHHDVCGRDRAQQVARPPRRRRVG